MFSSLEVKVFYPPDGGEGLAKRKGYRLRGVLRKRGAKARVDGQKPGTRRERGTSGRLTVKSISIKHAERRSGDCARKAAELTSGDLFRAVEAAEPAGRPADRGAEVSRRHKRSCRRQG